jgi:hypothetical protein
MLIGAATVASAQMALGTLTGARRGHDWADWMRWQEAHREIVSIVNKGCVLAMSMIALLKSTK